jgi:hypothetical protein
MVVRERMRMTGNMKERACGGVCSMGVERIWNGLKRLDVKGQNLGIEKGLKISSLLYLSSLPQGWEYGATTHGRALVSY